MLFWDSSWQLETKVGLIGLQTHSIVGSFKQETSGTDEVKKIYAKS